MPFEFPLPFYHIYIDSVSHCISFDFSYIHFSEFHILTITFRFCFFPFPIYFFCSVFSIISFRSSCLLYIFFLLILLDFSQFSVVSGSSVTVLFPFHILHLLSYSFILFFRTFFLAFFFFSFRLRLTPSCNWSSHISHLSLVVFHTALIFSLILLVLPHFFSFFPSYFFLYCSFTFSASALATGFFFLAFFSFFHSFNFFLLLFLASCTDHGVSLRHT